MPKLRLSKMDDDDLCTDIFYSISAKPLLLRTVRSITERRSLLTLGPVFDKINAGYRRHLDAVAAKANVGGVGGIISTLAPPTSVLLAPPVGPCNVFASNTPAVVVESVDLYSNVLAPLMEENQSKANEASKNNLAAETAKKTSKETEQTVKEGEEGD